SLPAWICGELFAYNLRRLRHERGLSQDDLAYEAEVSRRDLSQLEKGEFHASLKIVGKLVSVLNVEEGRDGQIERRLAGGYAWRLLHRRRRARSSNSNLWPGWPE